MKWQTGQKGPAGWEKGWISSAISRSELQLVFSPRTENKAGGREGVRTKQRGE